MMAFFSILFLLGRLSYQMVSLVVYSEYTPPVLLESLSHSIARESQYSIRILPISEALDFPHRDYTVTALFDFSFSVSYELRLVSLCSLRGLLYFTPGSQLKGESIFYLHPPPSVEGEAIRKVLEFLEWEEYHLLSSQQEDSKTKFHSLSDDPLLVISSEAPQQAYDRFIGRSVKPSGNWKVVALTDSHGASKTLNAFYNLRIFKERAGLIISSRGVWGNLDLGTIVVCEEGLEFSQSEGEYEFYSIRRALNALGEISSGNTITDNQKLMTDLAQRTEDRIISKNFSVLNFRPNLTIVGNVTDNVWLENLIFPGNVTYLNRSPPIIDISANLGIIDHDGSVSYANYFLNLAILPMVKIINKDPDLLSNFQLEIHGTDCGSEKFNYEYASKCMKEHINNLGAFYIDSLFETVGEGNINIFRENGVTIPHTGILYDNWALYDKENYPELFITTANRLYIYAILPYILNSFDWKEILVFFHDTTATDVYNAFMDNAEILEMKVLNELKNVPYVYPNQTFYDANEVLLKEAVKLKCRIYVLMLDLPHSLLFMESLYDLGLRRGDAVFILRDHFSYIIDVDSNGHDKEKVLGVADGSLTIFLNEYIGEYGKELQQQIAEYIYPDPTDFTCFQVDSLLLGVKTIDLMLKIGRNYEDPVDMNYFMRQQNFPGCSGTFSIDSQGNGRNELSFNIRNFYITEGTKWVEEEIGSYYIGITVPLKLSREIVWPNGSTEIPTDRLEDRKCGVNWSHIDYNHESIMMSFYVSLVLYPVVFVSGLAVWFKYYRFKHERILDKREILFEDGVEIAFPFIEGFYLTFMSLDGPYFVFSDENDYFELKDDNFWRLFCGTLGTIALWNCCVIFCLTLFDRRFYKTIKNLTRFLGLKMIPFFSKLAFIPAVWILLRVFECKQGDGESMTDSFLEYDCTMRCWSGFHLAISCVCLTVLALYSVLASISGPVYDEAMDYISIKTNTFLSFSRPMFGLLSILIYFHLREQYMWIFCISIVCLYIAWTVFVFKVESHNSVRLMMWEELIALGVCFNLTAAAIGEIGVINPRIIIIINLVVGGFLAICGFVWQYKYLPGLFYRKKGRNFTKLLSFAYTNKTSAKELTLHELDYRNNNHSLNYRDNIELFNAEIEPYSRKHPNTIT